MWNLHIVRTPGHQKPHRDIDQDITQAATGKFEGSCTIEVSNQHTSKAKQNKDGTHGKDQVEASESSENKTENSPTKHLIGSHFMTENNRHGSQRASMIQPITIVEVLIKVVGPNLQEQARKERYQKSNKMKCPLISRYRSPHQHRTHRCGKRHRTTGFEPYSPGRLGNGGSRQCIVHQK